MNNKMGGHSHSHGGALGFEPAPEPATTVSTVIPPRPEHSSGHDSSSSDEVTPEKEMTQSTQAKDEVVVSERETWEVEGQIVDPLVYRKMNSK